MRFFALLKKELRDCLPWLVSATAFLLVIGSIQLSSRLKPDFNYQYNNFQPYSEISYYELIKHPVSDTAMTLFMTVIGLAIALGVRQFWVDDFLGTWGFILHRSAGRAAILAAKICAGCLSLIMPAGLVWCYLFWRANLPDYSLVPLPERNFFEGWLTIGISLMFYLGTGLAGLNKAKWYTTKVMGLGFAMWMFLTITQEWSFWWGCAALAIGIVVLLYLMLESFLNRQFT
jgi:hypothetical protein